LPVCSRPRVQEGHAAAPDTIAISGATGSIHASGDLAYLVTAANQVPNSHQQPIQPLRAQPLPSTSSRQRSSSTTGTAAVAPPTTSWEQEFIDFDDYEETSPAPKKAAQSPKQAAPQPPQFSVHPQPVPQPPQFPVHPQPGHQPANLGHTAYNQATGNPGINIVINIPAAAPVPSNPFSGPPNYGAFPPSSYGGGYPPAGYPAGWPPSGWAPLWLGPLWLPPRWLPLSWIPAQRSALPCSAQLSGSEHPSSHNQQAGTRAATSTLKRMRSALIDEDDD